MELYHACYTDDIHRILEEGIQTTEWEGMDNESPPVEYVELPLEGEYYVKPVTVPKDGTMVYANTLVEHVLEQERPPELPKHHDAVFFFPEEKDVIEKYNREGIIVVDGDKLRSKYSLYAAPWETTVELFHGTLDEFYRAEMIHKERLHEQAQNYWQSVQEVTVSSPPENTELFVPTRFIDPEYFITGRNYVEHSSPL